MTLTFPAFFVEILYIWIFCSVGSILLEIYRMAKAGKVTNSDRIMLIYYLTPFAFVAFISLLAVVLFDLFKQWYNKPERVVRRIDRQLRRNKFKGPLVRLVEYLHKKMQERKS